MADIIVPVSAQANIIISNALKGDPGAKGDPGTPGLPGTPGAAGPGLASGGAAGQVLTKTGNNDYQTGWVSPSALTAGGLVLFDTNSHQWRVTVATDGSLVTTDLGVTTTTTATSTTSTTSTSTTSTTTQGGGTTTTTTANSGQSYNSLVLSDNPVLFMPLNNTSITDLSTNGFTGTLTGSPASRSMPNGESALDFNGTTQYINVPDNDKFSVTNTGRITVEAWISPDTLEFYDKEGGPNEDTSGNGNYVYFAGKGLTYGSSGNQEWANRMYAYTNTESRPNRISGYVFNPNGNLGAGSYFQDPVSVGEWIHYILVINIADTDSTYTTGYTKVYKNGVLRDQDKLSDYSIVPVNGNAPVRIATMNGSSFFAGAIGKFAIYNTELSQAQIQAHYNKMVSTTTTTTGSTTTTTTAPTTTTTTAATTTTTTAPTTTTTTTAAASASYVKEVGSANSNTSGTSLTVTVPAGGVAAGHALIATVINDYNNASISMSDNKGNTYTVDRTSQYATDGSMRVAGVSATVTTALVAGDTITVTFGSATTSKAVAISEFIGITSTSKYDVGNGAASTGATTNPNTNVTTTVNDIVFGTVFAETASTTGLTLDNSFTALPTVGNTSRTIYRGYKSVATPGLVNFASTLATASINITYLLGYKVGS